MRHFGIKFYELVDAVEDDDGLFIPDVFWAINKDGILDVGPIMNVYLDSTLEIQYCWYHHNLIPEKTRRDIQKIIRNGDYEAFLDYYDDFLGCGIEHFPTTAAVLCEGIDIGKLDVLHNSRVFNLITHVECECG